MPERQWKAAKALAGLGLLWAGSAATSAPAAVELRGPQIRSEITGRMVTDEHHWSHLYHADGRLERWEGKRHKGGHWQVKDNRLCLLMPEIDPKTPMCYRVFRQGRELEYRDDRSLAYRGMSRTMPK